MHPPHHQPGMLMFAALQVLTPSSIAAVTSVNTWKFLAADVTTVMGGAYLDTMAPTEISCAGQAKLEADSTLYCYEDPRCIVAHGDLGHVVGPQTAGWNCKSSESCSIGDMKLLPGDSMVLSPICPNTVSCSITGLQGTLEMTVPPITCCSAPFTMTRVGCLYIDPDTYKFFCDGHLFCRGVGSDFFTAETEEDTVALSTYISQNIDQAWDVYWVAALKDAKGVWRWEFGKGREVAASEWKNGYPVSTATYDCVYLRTNAKLENFRCNDAPRLPCHAPVPAC